MGQFTDFIHVQGDTFYTNNKLFIQKQKNWTAQKHASAEAAINALRLFAFIKINTCVNDV